MKEKIAAIILAGGRGSRMHSDVPKQYMEVSGRPLLYYTLKAFEDSEVEEIILVAGENDLDYCRTEIVEKFQFHKVKHITAGGRERYHSVYAGLRAVSDADYVLIHDGARPLVSQEIIGRNICEVRQCKACVTAVPAKDTVRISDGTCYAEYTPDRSRVWLMQTPQTFQYSLIIKAYEQLMAHEISGITDDAMVVETCLKFPVKFVEGDYRNIKVTTPEDMVLIQYFVSKHGN